MEKITTSVTKMHRKRHWGLHFQDKFSLTPAESDGKFTHASGRAEPETNLGNFSLYIVPGWLALGLLANYLQTVAFSLFFFWGAGSHLGIGTMNNIGIISCFWKHKFPEMLDISRYE